MSVVALKNRGGEKVVCMLHDDGERLRVWMNFLGAWWAEVSRLTLPRAARSVKGRDE